MDPLPDAQGKWQQMGRDCKGARWKDWQYHKEPLELKHEEEAEWHGKSYRPVLKGKFMQTILN